MSETYYRNLTMNSETVLKLQEGVLHINGDPLPGALTWIWDNLTLDPKPIDPETNGEAGAERRKEEAKSIQLYAAWHAYKESIDKEEKDENYTDCSIWNTINEVIGKEIPVNIIYGGDNYIVFIEEYLPSENRIRVVSTNAEGTLKKGSIWHFTVSKIVSICRTHTKY